MEGELCEDEVNTDSKGKFRSQYDMNERLIL